MMMTPSSESLDAPDPDTLNAWTALDFDASLSLLDDLDAPPNETLHGLESSVVQSPPLLPASDDADLATAALLADMLALTESSDAAASEAPAEMTTPSSSVSSTPPPAPPVKSKASSSRCRQRQEMEYLRVQVAELERELATLQQRASTTTDALAHQASVWEKIAKRQMDAKQRAEIENIKLRELVEGQLRVARSLEKLLRKRALAEDDELFVERKRVCGLASPSLDLEEAAREIHGRIMDQLIDVAPVIQQCGLHQITSDFDDARATSDAANAICMELTMVKVFPFDVAAVADAVWKLTSASRIDLPNGYFGASPRSASVSDLKFAVGLRLRRSEATIHVRGVGARRSTDEQSMIVFETVGATDGPLFAGQGIQCHERGYILIEKGPPSAEPHSTIVRACVRMWPEADDGGQLGDGSHRVRQAGLFVDLVVGSYNNNVKTMLQVIENMLLANCVQKST